MRRRLPNLLWTVLLCFAPVFSGAQEALPGEALLLLDARYAADAEAEGTSFADAVAAAVGAAFAERGLSVRTTERRRLEADDGRGEPELAREAGQSAGVRWVLVVRSTLDGRNLLWRIAAYDAEQGGLRAADAYSAFAGLSARPIIDDSARAVAQAWKTSTVLMEEDRSLVAFGQRFESADSGVAVRYGSAAGDAYREAGTVADGELTAAYAPFEAGMPVHLEVYRDGYWTKKLVLHRGVEEKPVELPRLQKVTESAWGASTGLGRLLGAGVAYRWYPLPDRVFLKGENAFWAAYDFMPGSWLVLHDEVRLGVGAYLQAKNDARFRYALGTGFSAIGTLLTNAPGYESPAGFDLTLEPFWFTLEYHFPAWALVLEERFPYSLGLDSGFLEQQWLYMNNMGPMFLSLGVLIKW